MKKGLQARLKNSFLTGLAALVIGGCGNTSKDIGAGGSQNDNSNSSNGVTNMTGVIPGDYEGVADCSDSVEYDGSYNENFYKSDIRVTINERGMPERNGIEILPGYSISGENADGTRIDLIASYVGPLENAPFFEIGEGDLSGLLSSGIPGVAIVYDATLNVNYDGRQIAISGEAGEFFLKCDSSCDEETNNTVYYFMAGYGEGRGDVSGLTYQTLCDLPEMRR